MPTLVFIDTSAHYALADAKDPAHAGAVHILQKVRDLAYALVTSNFVVSETYTLLLKRLGRQVAVPYVESLRRGSTTLIRVSKEEEDRAWEILQRYQDQDFSYVDATSFALMERLGIQVFFAFDDHFSVFRTREGKAFTDVGFI